MPDIAMNGEVRQVLTEENEQSILFSEKDLVVFPQTSEAFDADFLTKNIAEIDDRGNITNVAVFDQKTEHTRDAEPSADFELTVQRIMNSPSQEIDKIKMQLVSLMRDHKNPGQAFDKIEEVFVKNNLPFIGKAYKVFEILNPPHFLNAKIDNAEHTSPVLQNAGTREKYSIIYKDLLKTHILSGNKSLEDYLHVLETGESIITKYEEHGLASLSSLEQNRLKLFFSKAQTLYENSLLGQRNEDQRDSSVMTDEQIDESTTRLKIDLGVRDGQRISDRITEMFLKPLGYETVSEVLEAMTQAKQKAHERNIQQLEDVTREGYLDIHEGDLLKGVPESVIASMLESGSIAGEYLGEDVRSDNTPYDTDFIRATHDQVTNGFSNAIQKSGIDSFGDIAIGIRDRNQFTQTDENTQGTYDPDHYELIHYGEALQVSPEHYSVRTGIPSSEFDYIVISDELNQDPVEKEFLFSAIAKNGIFIPVVDREGKIVFTLETYLVYRSSFDGIERFGGNTIEISRVTNDSSLYAEIQETTKMVEENREVVEPLYDDIKELVERVLNENYVHLKDDVQFDWNLLGAELLNTGSTARYTNLPGDFDFDMTLILDAVDYARATTIKEQLLAALDPSDDRSRIDPGGYNQIRSFGSQAFEAQPDVDIGIKKRSELRVFGSYEVITEKLNAIKTHYGEDIHKEVLANIILAKKVLKEGKAYKLAEHGGMGGIGVETWILANQGNIEQAFRSFYNAAYDKGELLPLKDFRENYKIIDPGQDIRHGTPSTNYSYKMKEKGYVAMAGVIKSFLEKHEMIGDIYEAKESKQKLHEAVTAAFDTYFSEMWDPSLVSSETFKDALSGSFDTVSQIHDEETRSLLTSIVDQDMLAYFFKEDMSAEDVAREVSDLAEKYHCEKRDIMTLLRVQYLCTASGEKQTGIAESKDYSQDVYDAEQDKHLLVFNHEGQEKYNELLRLIYGS